MLGEPYRHSIVDGGPFLGRNKSYQLLLDVKSVFEITHCFRWGIDCCSYMCKVYPTTSLALDGEVIVIVRRAKRL